MDLSVIILNYNVKDQLRAALNSVFNSKTHFSYEVIVVDNGSADGSAEMAKTEFPQVTLIQNQNIGFSAGNNSGIKIAKGEYILLLNPDTEVQSDVFEACLTKMQETPDVGILTCKLLKPDGTLDLAARRTFPNPWNSFSKLFGLGKLFPTSKKLNTYNLNNYPIDQEMYIDSCVGAFLLVRKEVVEKIGLMDEEYYMYGEDIDWCYRAKQHGYEVLYYPKVTTIHYKGQSSRKVPFRMLYYFHRAMWIFYRKHYKQNYFFLFSWLIWLGIYGRFAVLVLINFFRKNRYVSK